MLAMTVRWRARKNQDDHIRAESADIPYDVAEQLVMGPLREGLLGVFGETEIDGAREELLGSIDPPRCEQFLRAHDAQFVALFAADQVLAALAPGQGKVRRAYVPAAREIRQKRRILVVGVS